MNPTLVPWRGRRLRPLAACLAAFALGGCAGAQDYAHTASRDAASIAHFGAMALVCFALATAGMWVLLLWVAKRRSGHFTPPEVRPAPHAQRWIWIGGLAIPLLAFVGLFTQMFKPMHAEAMADGMAGTPMIRVTAQRWWFSARYLSPQPAQEVEVPTVMHIPVGRDVTIELVSRDVIHSFWVPKLQGKVDLIPGRVNRIVLNAREPGLYQGECAEFCGVEHAQMRLRIVAESPAAFEHWLAQQRQGASLPASEQTSIADGYQAFMHAPCPVCHTVRGTPALGSIGPDLTHVASRDHIAGGMLVNNTANMAAWISNAQALKPGARMPSLPELDPKTVMPMVSFLESLR